MKQISNEFIIRALNCDGYEHAGFISSAASALLVHLARPSSRLSPRALRCATSAKTENAEPPVRRKKILSKRLPVIYFPASVTVPPISVKR